MLSFVNASLVTLGLVILVHELGHFAVCKWTGIYVKTFSIGFGPKFLRRRIGETEYALSVVPFGGYVKMAGEGVMEEIQDAGTGQAQHYPIGTVEGDRIAAKRDDAIPESRHFRNRPTWQRLAVVTAGPLANLLLAWVIYTVTVLSGGLPVIPTTTVGSVPAGGPGAEAGLLTGDRIVAVDGETVHVWSDVENAVLTPSIDDLEHPRTVTLDIERGGVATSVPFTPGLVDGLLLFDVEPEGTEVGLVQRDGPADAAGLERGDVITALDGNEVHSFGDIARYVNARPDQPVLVSWLRDGQLIEREIIPEASTDLPDTVIGRIYFERAYGSRTMPFGEAVAFGWRWTMRQVVHVVDGLASLVEHGMEAIGGPIRVGKVAGDMLRWSVGRLMLFIAFFSVNLFVLNLLPIPVLDGGHVVFIIYEMIFRRPVQQRIQAIATQVGLIVLMLFMILVIVRDVLTVVLT